MVRVLLGIVGTKHVFQKVEPSIAQAFRTLASVAESYEGEEKPGFELRVILHTLVADDLAPDERDEFFRV